MEGENREKASNPRAAKWDFWFSPAGATVQGIPQSPKGCWRRGCGGWLVPLPGESRDGVDLPFPLRKIGGPQQRQVFFLVFGSERILEKVGWGSFCGEGIHPCLPRVAHIPRGSEMSLMISSLHTGGDRRTWAGN